MKSIAIIPARGGSKRIPRKNIKSFCGKPIIAYSIEAALESNIFDEVMVSTDDKEIAEIASSYGAKVPFFRSPEMSSDTAMTVPVLLEVLGEYKKCGKEYDLVCCIYPTAPFINSARLCESMNKLEECKADSVLPVVKYSYPPQRALIIRENKLKMVYPENYNVRSQDLEPIYHDAGQFYFLKIETLKNEQTLYCGYSIPIILPEVEVQDIDNEEDWNIAEMKYQILNKASKVLNTVIACDFGGGHLIKAPIWSIAA